MMNLYIPNLIIAVTLLGAIVGCHDPSLEIAREAARRQAEQNHEMARVTSEAAAAVRRLVEEQGQARRDMTAAHRDLHRERLQLGDSWNELEAQRQIVASSRRTESFLASIVRGGGAVFAAILALGIAWLTLFGLSRHDDSAAAACELLVNDLASTAPQLSCLPPAEPALHSDPPAPQLTDER